MSEKVVDAPVVERVWIEVTNTNGRIVRYGVEQGEGGTVKIQVLTSNPGYGWSLDEMELPASEFQRFNQ